ncbi:hypothetical protein Pan216_17050 [Planctomycetes bacterium Pan216]|uniref:Uncharacterized protein n=1 Tax=Kolteria novifilia TaxID=2527975 RepID=A0A518B1M7_9BACT|nr:hypothetical protein Pan216_17050 [Planctomycetes bacterium Pan216]
MTLSASPNVGTEIKCHANVTAAGWHRRARRDGAGGGNKVL